MKQHTHVTYEERYCIEKMIPQGVRAIARTLGRSPGTISDEIKKNSTSGIYNAKKADHKAYIRRYRSKRTYLKVGMDRFLCRYVEKRLRERWSPKQISGELRRTHHMVCSDKAIYKFVRRRSLDHLLFWGWNKKRSGPKRNTWGKASDGRKYITERPNITDVGNYEMDFIVSTHNSYVLLVLTDIITKYSMIHILPNRKHETICSVLSEMLIDHPVKSITTDNDIAFNCWKTIERQLDISIYFTHPYCSWEKGLVENTNRWIRCFVPKKQDIRSVPHKVLRYAYDFVNNRPREIIDFRTPKEYYLEMCGVRFEG